MVMRMRTRFLYELPDDNDNDDDSLGIITLDVQYESLSAKFCCYFCVCFSFVCLMPRHLPQPPFYPIPSPVVRQQAVHAYKATSRVKENPRF